MLAILEFVVAAAVGYFLVIGLFALVKKAQSKEDTNGTK